MYKVVLKRNEEKYFYLNELNRTKEDYLIIKEIHDEARKSEVPIILDDGLDFLLMVVRMIKPKRILELGTAVGFSAIMMAKNSSALIETIERNSEMYEKALSNIKKCGLDDCITVYHDDALLFDEGKLQGEYDLIFIDAGKAQNIRFFTKYSKYLSKTGVILTDNILFHGLVEEYVNTGTLSSGSKDLKAMVRKIHEYNMWLKDNKEFSTTFIRVGDGIAVSSRRGNDENK